MIKPKVYVETSVISYLTALPSRDLITAARQQITHDWWEKRQGAYELFISQIVVNEAGAGNPDFAARRLAVIQPLPLLQFPEAGDVMVQRLIQAGPLPPKAAVDAAHIVAAMSNGIDYLLTWNFKHLANASIRNRLEATCQKLGFVPPVICTPEELP